MYRWHFKEVANCVVVVNRRRGNTRKKRSVGFSVNAARRVVLTVFKEGGTRASIRDIVLPDMLQVFVDESAAAVYDPTPATAVPLDPHNRRTGALRNARVQLPPEPPLAMPEPSLRAAQRKASEGDGPPGGGGSS